MQHKQKSVLSVKSLDFLALETAIKESLKDTMQIITVTTSRNNVREYVLHPS